MPKLDLHSSIALQGRGGDRKQRPDNAARLRAERRAPNGEIGGNAGDRARADGLVLATPSPPAPAAAGAPGCPRAPLPSQHRARRPKRWCQAGCAGAAGSHPSPFSPPRTQRNKLKACSTRPSPGGSHRTGPGSSPCSVPASGTGWGQPGGAGRWWAPAPRSPAAADGAPRPRAEPAAFPGRGARLSTDMARPGRKRKRRLQGSPAPASLMNANIYHLHVKV